MCHALAPPGNPRLDVGPWSNPTHISDGTPSHFGEIEPTWALVGEGACSRTGTDTMTTVLQFGVSTTQVPAPLKVATRGTR